MRESIIISVMVDTIVYGILFVLALGTSISSATTNCRWNSRRVEECRFLPILQQVQRSQVCGPFLLLLSIIELIRQRLGNATIGLGWILVFLVSYTITWLTAAPRDSRFPSILHPST